VMITKTGIDKTGALLYQWYTDNMKQIHISSSTPLEIGGFVDVKIVDSKHFLLFGEIS
jgi:tRNA A37 methylthiotransferase MiaB